MPPNQQKHKHQHSKAAMQAKCLGKFASAAHDGFKYGVVGGHAVLAWLQE